MPRDGEVLCKGRRSSHNNGAGGSGVGVTNQQQQAAVPAEAVLRNNESRCTTKQRGMRRRVKGQGSTPIQLPAQPTTGKLQLPSSAGGARARPKRGKGVGACIDACEAWPLGFKAGREVVLLGGSDLDGGK
ncbi:hypothetical protein G7046_g2311 [Stylonectria norvegica]|nr:hypothetical protein G7046_g2311 [Stylonectria norvegica]